MPNPSANQTRDRSDLSQFLIHLTKNGTFQAFHASRNGGYYFRPTTVNAQTSLNAILANRKIEANQTSAHVCEDIPEEC